MHIEHVAIWTHSLEELREFYCRHFQARCGHKYRNPHTGFESYFLTLDGSTRLELMQMPGIPPDTASPHTQRTGLIHLALKLGSPDEVDRMTLELAQCGVSIVSEPRRTGDGYYEACILDPDGNRIELVA